MGEREFDVAPWLADAAGALPVGVAPVAAIMAGGRARGRRRAGGSVLAASVAAAALGLTQFGATNGAGASADPFSRDYGTFHVATGRLGGVDWTLTTVFRPGTDAERKEWRGAAGPCTGRLLYEDAYIQTPDSVRDKVVTSGGACLPSDDGNPPWTHLFDSSGLFTYSIVQIGIRTPGEASPYGSIVVGLMDETRIAKVQLTPYDGHLAQTAELVKAAGPENGTYFLSPLSDKAWNGGNLPGTLTFFDHQGNRVHPPNYTL